MAGRFYITTTLPYVNAAPHIGFAHEFVLADVIARYHRLQGQEVFFNTGTDEHGLKIYKKALEEKKEPERYVREYAAKFEKLRKALDLSYDNFIRTTDPHHVAAAQEFWNRCLKNGDIYLAPYKAKYCVGCELEKTDSELVDEKCPLHPNLEIENIEEENYFFRFSKYEKRLLKLYEEDPSFVVPANRLLEIKNFVASGLRDFSISRVKEKMPWGIPVPNDDTQVMYVWFDALVNYISTLGWPEHEDKFRAFWGTEKEPLAIQVAGKDNLRPQAAMWQAMLMSAGIPRSKRIFIYGFITSDGAKMSKSLGNVVDPYDVIAKYGTDALRYWLTREIPLYEDGDFTWKKFAESYNANLANGLGNLVSRTAKMAELTGTRVGEKNLPLPEAERFLSEFKLKEAADVIWRSVADADIFVQKTEPFRTVKTDPARARRDVQELMEKVVQIGMSLRAFLPGTAEVILSAMKNPTGLEKSLFPRIVNK